MGWEGEGPYFEDISVGMKVKHWPGRTITQTDNIILSQIAMDYTPLYIDIEYAKLAGYKDCPVNPRLLHAMFLGMTVKDTSINSVAFLGMEYERYLRPVYPGDTLYVETEVMSVRESKSRPNAGIVSWVHMGYNQRNEKVYETKRTNLVYKKEASPWRKFFRSQPENSKVLPFLVDSGVTPRGFAPGWSGRQFDDLKIGEKITHRVARTVSYYDNILFSSLCLNLAPLHYDGEYMTETEFKKVILVAPMTVAILTGIASADLTMHLGAELSVRDLTFSAPVFDGDTLRARSEVIETKEYPGNSKLGRVLVKTIGYKDTWKTVVCEFTRELLLFKKGSSPMLRCMNP